MTNLQHTTENLTIHIKVKDYSAWRQAYDGREKSRLARVLPMAEFPQRPRPERYCGSAGCRRRGKGALMVGLG